MEIVKNEQKVSEYRARAKELVSQMTLEEKVGQTLNMRPSVRTPI